MSLIVLIFKFLTSAYIFNLKFQNEYFSENCNVWKIIFELIGSL